MKNEPHPEPIQRILAENPEIERVRIDAGKREVEVAFADELPGPQVLERIDAALAQELPYPA